jgi:parvulin-like peptidyl-prolyl isomerase
MIFNKERKEKEKHAETSEMMHKFKQNPLVFIGTVLVLILVIVTFVFWGAGDWILPKKGVLSDSELTFGVYDGIPIELTPGSFFAEQRAALREQQRGGRNTEEAITEQAFKTAVIRTAVLDAMKKARYEPPKEAVDRKMAQLPRYQENGKFSLLRWRQDSAATRLALQKSTRDNFITLRYYADVAAREIETKNADENTYTPPRYAYSVLVPSKEAGFIGEMAKVQRRFKITAFPYARFPDAEARAFAQKNPALFKSTRLSQITLRADKDGEMARKVRESIESGATSFEDAAKNQSEDEFRQSGGDAGERMAFELSALVPSESDRAALIALAPGSMSAPVKTSGAWAIFRAESAARDADLNDKVTLDKIRAYLVASEKGIIEDWLIGRAEDFIKDVEKNDWDTAVLTWGIGESGIESKEFGPVPLNYGDSTLFSRLRSYASTIPELSDAAESENFWKAAFSTPVGKPSAPFVISASQESVVVLYPVEENADDAEAVKNSSELYRGSFIENEVFQSIEDTILNSAKFKNNFTERYYALYSNDYFSF